MAEGPEETVVEKHPPRVEEVEEGALRSSMLMDVHQSQHLGQRCYHFLLDSPVRESKSFDLEELESQDVILVRWRNDPWWFF